ncbi:MAG: NfeD family protein [Candidatus Anstonellales archaeon]
MNNPWAFMIGFLTSILVVIVILIYNKHLQKQPIKTGGESLIGKIATVKKTFKSGKGLVLVNSEVWSCQSVNGKNYKEGEKVKIIGFEGVYLKTE